jgi:hypothetical protein
MDNTPSTTDSTENSSSTMMKKNNKRPHPITSFFERMAHERSYSQSTSSQLSRPPSANGANAAGSEAPSQTNKQEAAVLPSDAPTGLASGIPSASRLDRSNTVRVRSKASAAAASLPAPFSTALAAFTDSTGDSLVAPFRAVENMVELPTVGYKEESRGVARKKPRGNTDDDSHNQAQVHQATPTSSSRLRTSVVSKPIANENIAHRLFFRSTVGSQSRMFVPNLQWRTASWLKFYDVSAPSFQFSKTYSRMAWDKDGVLLAVSSDSLVRIYDWDMVRWADVKARNLRAKKEGGEFAVEPILLFQIRSSNNTPCNVTFLSWSPYNSDELIVGTWNGDVVLYDLGTELRNGAPWHRTLFCANDRLSKHQSVSSVVLVQEGKLLVVCLESSVFCVSVGTRRIVWEWSPLNFGRVSCIEAVPRTNLVLVGSSSGYVSLLDYSVYHRQGFACSVSPAVLRTWISHSGCGPTPRGCDMGIRQIRFNNDLPFSHGSDTTFVSISFTWVTSCGWVMRSSIDAYSDQKPRTSILHSTAPVQLENSSGVPVPQTTTPCEWSLPVDSCVASAGTLSSLIWEGVPEVRRVLPNSDQRVLDSKPRILRDTSNPRLFLISDLGYPARVQTIRLSQRKGRPLALSVHPSQEWIVVALSNELCAISARGIAK